MEMAHVVGKIIGGSRLTMLSLRIWKHWEKAVRSLLKGLQSLRVETDDRQPYGSAATISSSSDSVLGIQCPRFSCTTMRCLTMRSTVLMRSTT